ncbi:MAG: hypothetical protein Q9166_004026 [cf. Caloplaca sp. 2 TL-2023]
MLRELGTQWESFSSTFCIEKDSINRAFRELVEGYATAMTSNPQEMTLPSVALLPSKYLLRFINSYFLYSWYLQPEPYSLQVKAEIDFRIREFIEDSILGLDSILLASRPINSKSRTQVFEVAINRITNHRFRLEERIAEFPVWQQGFLKPEDRRALDESLTLAKQIDALLRKIKHLTETSKAYSGKVGSQFQDFRQNLKNMRFFKLSSTSLISILELPLDHLDPINSARIQAYVSEMRQVCKEGKMIPREQYPICLINSLRVTFSGIDDDNLGIDQRSWCMEREEAVNRYELQAGTDDQSILDLAMKFHQDHIHEDDEDGVSIPADA